LLQSNDSQWAFLRHSLSQKEEGNNEGGQEGVAMKFGSNLGAMAKAVQMVACGRSHTLALTRGGAIWAWGDNEQGQCGTALTGGDKVQIYSFHDTYCLCGYCFHSIKRYHNSTFSSFSACVGRTVVCTRKGQGKKRNRPVKRCWNKNNNKIYKTNGFLMPEAVRAVRAVVVVGVTTCNRFGCRTCTGVRVSWRWRREVGIPCV